MNNYYNGWLLILKIEIIILSLIPLFCFIFYFKNIIENRKYKFNIKTFKEFLKEGR